MTDTGIAKLENQREELSAASPSETRYTHFWEAEQKTIVVLGLALLPWVCVAMFTAGPLAAFDVIAYGLLALLAGYVVVCAILPSGSRASVIVLAPATGVLTLSALTAFWLRLGLPLIGSSTVWFVLAALGVVCFWRDRGQLRTARIPYGISLVAISASICASFHSRCSQRRRPATRWGFHMVQYRHPALPLHGGEHTQQHSAAKDGWHVDR